MALKHLWSLKRSRNQFCFYSPDNSNDQVELAVCRCFRCLVHSQKYQICLFAVLRWGGGKKDCCVKMSVAMVTKLRCRKSTDYGFMACGLGGFSLIWNVLWWLWIGKCFVLVSVCACCISCCVRRHEQQLHLFFLCVVFFFWCHLECWRQMCCLLQTIKYIFLSLYFYKIHVVWL